MTRALGAGVSALRYANNMPPGPRKDIPKSVQKQRFIRKDADGCQRAGVEDPLFRAVIIPFRARAGEEGTFGHILRRSRTGGGRLRHRRGERANGFMRPAQYRSSARRASARIGRASEFLRGLVDPFGKIFTIGFSDSEFLQPVLEGPVADPQKLRGLCDHPVALFHRPEEKVFLKGL